MTQFASPVAAKPPPTSPDVKWVDPVLKELWDVKRAINVEAKFDVKEIARMANAYRLESVLQQKL